MYIGFPHLQQLVPDTLLKVSEACVHVIYDEAYGDRLGLHWLGWDEACCTQSTRPMDHGDRGTLPMARAALAYARRRFGDDAMPMFVELMDDSKLKCEMPLPANSSAERTKPNGPSNSSGIANATRPSNATVPGHAEHAEDAEDVVRTGSAPLSDFYVLTRPGGQTWYERKLGAVPGNDIAKERISGNREAIRRHVDAPSIVRLLEVCESSALLLGDSRHFRKDVRAPLTTLAKKACTEGGSVRWDLFFQQLLVAFGCPIFAILLHTGLEGILPGWQSLRGTQWRIMFDADVDADDDGWTVEPVTEEGWVALGGRRVVARPRRADEDRMRRLGVNVSARSSRRTKSWIVP